MATRPSFSDWLPAMIAFVAAVFVAVPTSCLQERANDRVNDRLEREQDAEERVRVAEERARLRTLHRALTLNAVVLKIIVDDLAGEATETSCGFPGERYLLSEAGVAAALPLVEGIPGVRDRNTVINAIDDTTAFNLLLVRSETLTCGELVTTAGRFRKDLSAAAGQLTKHLSR